MTPSHQPTPEQNEALRKMLAKGTPASHINPRSVGIGKEKAVREDRYRSKWERLWGMELEDRKRRGEFIEVRYEEQRLLVGRGSKDGKQREAWVKFDFLAVKPDKTEVIFEVKGYMRRSDRDRLLVAAERYPWKQFVLVTREGGRWKEEVL